MSPALIRSLLPLIPTADDSDAPVVVMTLSKKTAVGVDPDTRATSITVNARRRPLKMDEQVSLGITVPGAILFTVYNDEAYSGWQAPENEDRLIDPQGLQYTVKNVKETALKVLYSCACIPEYTSG